MWIDVKQVMIPIAFNYCVSCVWHKRVAASSRCRSSGWGWWICTCSALPKNRLGTSDTSKSQRYRVFLSLRLPITGNCQGYSSELHHSFSRRVTTPKKAYIKTFGWTTVLVTKRQDFLDLLTNKQEGSCKIEVRHILFKKICFFDFFKYSPNCLSHNNLLFEKKKQKTIFFFSKYA